MLLSVIVVFLVAFQSFKANSGFIEYYCYLLDRGNVSFLLILLSIVLLTPMTSVNFDERAVFYRVLMVALLRLAMVRVTTLRDWLEYI